eukprot:scaffold62159_cov53-Phaeocystis_antarctica.AAC.1
MGLGDYFSEKSEKDYILQGACPRQPAPQLDLRIRTAHTHIASTSPVDRVEARDLGARELPRGREEGNDRALRRGGHDSGGRDCHRERLRQM